MEGRPALGDHVAFTVEGAHASVPVPVGMVPISTTVTGATFAETAAAPDDVSAHRTLIVRRWSTVTGHAPSAETVALLALHDSPLSDDWTGATSTTTVDGAPASVRSLRDHDGIVGTVTTCALIDSVVTLRATWHRDDTEAPGLFHRTTSDTRLLHIDDLMVDRASLYHPLLGVSLVFPIGWDIDSATDDRLTLVNGETTITVSRTVLDRFEDVLEAPVTMPPLVLTVTGDRGDVSAHIRAVSDGPDPLAVDAAGVDARTRADTLAIIASFRTHPR